MKPLPEFTGISKLDSQLQKDDSPPSKKSENEFENLFIRCIFSGFLSKKLITDEEFSFILELLYDKK